MHNNQLNLAYYNHTIILFWGYLDTPSRELKKNEEVVRNREVKLEVVVEGRLGVTRIVVQITECPVIILLHRKFHGKPGQEKSLW